MKTTGTLLVVLLIGTLQAGRSIPAQPASSDAISIPQLLNYQGRLADLAGNPVPNDTYTLKFEIYNVATGGTALWTETQPAVTVVGGLFNVLLGSVSPVTAIPAGPGCYLQVTVRADPAIAPRNRMVSAPYAYKADDAGKLQGRAVADAAPGTGQVLEWNGSTWTPATDDAGTSDNAWVRGSPADSVLYTIRQLELARGGAKNRLYGSNQHTHVNLGVACTTGLATSTESLVTVSGGRRNRACSSYATVGGGLNNWAQGSAGLVAGGRDNLAWGSGAVIGGGTSNQVNGRGSLVIGGEDNLAAYDYAAVGGGFDNIASGNGAFVGGGSSNRASGTHSTVAGGWENENVEPYATVGGGRENYIFGLGHGTIGGGWGDSILASYGGTIGGGQGNIAEGDYSTIGGGYSNGTVTAASDYATVSGGFGNRAANLCAAIGGGHQNSVSGQYSTVSGGRSDTVVADCSVICGGVHNVVRGDSSVIGGGADNYILGVQATVAGGWTNRTGALRAAIGGGAYNYITGTNGTIPGGYGDTVLAGFGMAAGFRTRLASNALYTFAFGENCTTRTARAVVFYHSGGATKLGVGIQNPAWNADVAGTGRFSGKLQAQAGFKGDTAAADSEWVTRAYVRNGGTDNDWVHGGDSVLYTIRRLGIARGGSGNVLLGSNPFSHVNLGIACTTGRAGRNDSACTVAGGWRNVACTAFAFIGGGNSNRAGGRLAAITGGYLNDANGSWTAIAGGYSNSVTGYSGTVGGGYANAVTGSGCATVAGGTNNQASDFAATVAGGRNNLAGGYATTVAGGWNNVANGYVATVGGGQYNPAGGNHTAIPGGLGDTVLADYGLAAGYRTRLAVPAQHTFAFGENCTTRTARAVVFYHSGGATKLGVGVQNPAWNADVAGTGRFSGKLQARAGFKGDTAVADSEWVTRAYARSGAADNDWVHGGDSVLYTIRQLGIARGGSGNALLGAASYTHVNLGVACVTGSASYNDTFNTVAGGRANLASGRRGYTTVGGGCYNEACSSYATISGGAGNYAYGAAAAIGGGANNNIGSASSFGTIAGGWGNTVSAGYALVAGGASNQANGEGSAVGGGTLNRSSGSYSAVGGGRMNSPSGHFTFVGGGFGNTALDSFGAVAGGRADTAFSKYCGALAGRGNVAGGDGNDSGAVVAGGFYNRACSSGAFVGGGRRNDAGVLAVVAGGSENVARATCATVGGGENNSATGIGSTVGGGSNNVASVLLATVPGGYANSANGMYSFAAGRQARSNNAGCFTWSDNSGTDLNNGTGNRWMARASGGVYFYTNAGATTGSYLDAGSGSWTSLSDRNRKRDIRPVNTRDILEKVARMPISRWGYETEAEGIDHLGPMAQDFHAAFGLGPDDKGITTIDADGVALAAIQALYEELRAERADNAAQAERIARLETELAKLRK